MLYKQLTDKYKAIKKKSYLDSIGKFKRSYAFLGVGNHSINNLYPCLQHLNVNLKYVYSHSISNAQIMSKRFAGCEAVADFSKLLTDKSVDGIFISLRPKDQFEAVKLALSAGKKVFVEKPPCQSSEQLGELIANAGGTLCFPGLQRRFATMTNLLVKHKLTETAETYRYVFQTGLYPEGDIETELFIHSIDFLLYIFGDYQTLQVQCNRSHGGVTYHVQVEHKSGVKGQLELSSHFSWNNVSETLEINSPKRITRASYPYRLSATDKSVMFNVPVEKISKGPATERVYLDAMNFIPGLETNSLVLQGFFDEIYSFLDLCESGKMDRKKTIESLASVYRFIRELKDTV